MSSRGVKIAVLYLLFLVQVKLCISQANLVSEAEYYSATSGHNGTIDQLLADASKNFIDVNFAAAYENLLKALKISERDHNKRYISICYNRLGNFYFFRDADFTLSTEYFQKALNIATSINESNLIASSYRNLAKVSSAKESLAFLNLAKQYYRPDADSGEIAAMYCDMGIAYFELNARDSGFKYYQKTLDVLSRHKNFLNEIITNYNIAEEYYNDANLAQYFLYMHRSLDIAIANNAKVEICNVARDLSIALVKSGSFKEAIPLLELSYRYKDSIYNEQRLKEFYKSKLGFEMAIKEKQIQLLQKEKIIKNNTLQRYYILTASLTIVLILLAAGSIYYYKNQKEKRIALELIATQNVKINDQKQASLVRLQEIQSIRSNMEGQEKATTKIGNELHDGVASAIAAIKLKLSNIPTQENDELKTIKENLDTIYEMVRDISHDLAAAQLTTRPFFNLLNDTFNSLQKNGSYNVDIILDPEEEINALPHEIKINVYRILQELVVNFMKHAKATALHLSLQMHTDHLNMIYEDNGIGFDVASAKKQGIGIQNISQRILLLNGEWTIDSQPGKGTNIIINIPCYG